MPKNLITNKQFGYVMTGKLLQKANKHFNTIDDLRERLVSINKNGADYLDYLLEGNYSDGKGVWVNDNPEVRSAYESVIFANPHLKTASPYSEYFRRHSIRVRGENRVKVLSIQDAPSGYQATAKEYDRCLHAQEKSAVAIFSGGPAAKIASILSLLNKDKLDVKYVLDGAEQSNESGSACYEHINHANALNAEHDNSGLGILFLAIKRSLFGEKDPNVAIDTDYHKVDVWPKGLHWRDVPIYFENEIHGRVQWLKSLFRIQNDHDKSRFASKISTHILSYIQNVTGVKLRLDDTNPRAVFVYFTKKHHQHSLKDEKILTKSINITPKKLTTSEVLQFYGPQTLSNIFSADIFYENSCIRHGFEAVCGDIIEGQGGVFQNRTAIRKVFLDRAGHGDETVVCGVEVEDLKTHKRSFQPCSYLGLSFGPTATFEYGSSKSLLDKLKDRLKIGLPVPYQTIATGFTAQILFRITDRKKFKELPYTGLKQTHFVEIGQNSDYILIKLTSGGNIGLPVYSRSYAISAIANMLRILTPDTGLEFYDVVCAWPCARGVNGTNNGQVVRLANNCAARFGEGGTGMSKMGTNAQTLLDMIGINVDLLGSLKLPKALYKHTIIDNRKSIGRRTSK